MNAIELSVAGQPLSKDALSASLTDLAGIGVRLWEEMGQLRFRAPKGVMTDVRLAWLRDHKAAVLDYLRKQEHGTSIIPDAEGRHLPFPVTDVQAAYLLGRHSAFAFGGLGCHGYLEVATGFVNPERVAAAWNALIVRHDMLRAVVHPDGHQQVLENVELPGVPVTDLRGCTPGQIAQSLAATREQMSHRVYATERWPLHELRLTLLDGSSVLHLSLDLLIADLLSTQRLLVEFDQLYAGQPLPPLEVTFRDYVIAMRASREPGNARAARFERDRAYWWNRLDELPAAPELPVRVDASSKSSAPRFRRLQCRLSSASWSALVARSAKLGLTPSNTVLSAYAEVLGRFSRRPDFTLNITMLGREPLHPQVEQLVGDFTTVSLLAVTRPNDRAEERSFLERARAIQDQLVQDMEHQTCSGVEVIRELARRRGTAAALMPVVYTSALGLDDTKLDGSGPFGGGQFLEGVSQTPQVWIDCQVLQHRGELLIHWDVREGVLIDGVVESIFASFEDLLCRLAASEDALHEPSPMRLPAEQRAVRQEVNSTVVKRPQRVLHAAFLQQAGKTPDAPAIITETRMVSYGALSARASEVARELTARGVRRGEIVGITLPRGPEQAIAVLGVVMAGAAYLPVDTTQPRLRRHELLVRAGVKVVLTNRALGREDWPESMVPLVVDLDGAPPPASSGVGRIEQVDEGGLAYVIYTSGSTGSPKGVMTTHRAAWNTIADINERFALTDRDRVLGIAQLGFDLSVWDIFGPLSVGAALVVPDAERRSDPSHWAELIRDRGVTVWNSVPAQLQMLQEYLASDGVAQLPGVRCALLSGDWIPVALPERVRSHLPRCRLFSLGGATEAAIWSIWHPIEQVAPGAVSIPYGKPLSNQTFHVLDGTLRPKPDYVPGELFIGGMGVALGYLGDPELTAARFIEHPDTGERLYRTGDFGRYWPDGTIEFLGREDLQVKIRGHRIETAEIEAVLANHPAVAGAAVLVTGDDPLHRRLAAFCSTGRFAKGEPDGRADLREFVERARAHTTTARAAAEAGRAAAREAGASIDVGRVVELVRVADRVCLMAMVSTLRAVGLFAPLDVTRVRESGTTSHSFSAIVAASGTHPRHQRLLRRWLSALVAEQWLGMDDRTGEYRDLREFDRAELEAAQERMQGLQAELDYSAELLRYLQLNLDRLPDLLRGSADPLELLFPQAQLGTAQAAYQDNLMSRYLNRIVTAVATTLVGGQAEGRPLRVLEVGAGVGGTGKALIEAFAHCQAPSGVDYFFTDISQFFLNEARQRFAEYPWVRYGTFDLNVDYRRQGLSANSFDLIVCANVLHNAKHAAQGLSRLSELLGPGGGLLFVEATRENYPLLVSMEFQEGLGGFVDARAETGQTFLGRAQWQRLLDDLGARTELCLPDEGDALEFAGQHVFFARVKTDHLPVHAGDLLSYAAERLPPYMVPSSLDLVDQLPVSGNGKIDRSTLQSWLQARNTNEPQGMDPSAEPRDDLERQLAGLFAELLGVARVGRDSDFYATGGDSLLIAQLVGRLRDRVAEASAIDWDTLLRAVIRTPTVAGVAEFLRAPGPIVGDDPRHEERSPVLLLRGTQPGMEGATVLVHDGSGTLAPYRRLLARLAPGPVLGLNISHAARYLDLDASMLIDHLAADYARVLLEQKRQSYRIVGYCMGGLVATEVARHLMEAGVRVELLMAISCYRVPYQILDELLLEYAFARVMGAGPTDLGYPDDDVMMGKALQTTLYETPGMLPDGRFAQLDGSLGEVGAKFASLALHEPRERLAAIGRAIAGGDGLPIEQVETVYRFFRHSLNAVTAHEAAPYAGDITFVQDSGTIDFMPGLRFQMHDYWSNLCLGDLRTVEVSGNHFTCMEDPHVEAIARLVTQRDAS